MTDYDGSFRSESAHQLSVGDPSLELFGQGWAPAADAQVNTPDPYVGRHRAPDA